VAHPPSNEIIPALNIPIEGTEQYGLLWLAFLCVQGTQYMSEYLRKVVGKII
jgi:hypothetical protein